MVQYAENQCTANDDKAVIAHEMGDVSEQRLALVVFLHIPDVNRWNYIHYHTIGDDLKVVNSHAVSGLTYGTCTNTSVINIE